MECPKCNGAVWDNREKKASGEFSAKGPDFACKDKDDCGWVKWPPKDKNGQAAKAPAQAKAKLDGLAMMENLVIAFHYISECLGKLGYETDKMYEPIQRMATSAAIAADQAGVDLRASYAAKGKKSEPEPEPADEEEELPF